MNLLNVLQINETITLSNCSESAVCRPDHSVHITNITCHVNATCELKDGVFGCHCPYGQFGDGINSCDRKCESMLELGKSLHKQLIRETYKPCTAANEIKKNHTATDTK